jgi:hypothetical protein
MKSLYIALLTVLFSAGFAAAETRQELDTRTRSNLMGRPTSVLDESNASSGVGFSIEKNYKTDSCDCGLNKYTGQYHNSLRVALSCSEDSAPLPIPARFKKVSWSIKEATSAAAVMKGNAQTDKDGVVMIYLTSYKKDLSENHFELQIGDSVVTVTAGQGPYSFDHLPFKACARAKAE